jgi:glycosyltransferase involved in cell wall biosynthesis
MTKTASIIIPCRNEAAFIERCLAAVQANDFPKDDMEIIVIDGMSDDGTRDILARHPGLQVIDNPNRTTPHALNLGIRAAQGDFIVRVDAHSEIHPDYISRCIHILKADSRVGCVGGVFENVHGDGTSHIISMALSSPFGVGNAKYRLRPQAGPADTVPFGAFPRRVFETVGLFDEELLRNQDDEFNFRLRKAGFVVWLDPAIRVKYHVRPSFARMARQFRQYGFWKVYVNRKHRAITTLRQLVPPVFLVALVGGAVAAVFSVYALIAWAVMIGIYLLAAWVSALRKTAHLGKALQLVWCFFVLHMAYGMGYLHGLWRFVVLRKKPASGHGSLTR